MRIQYVCIYVNKCVCKCRNICINIFAIEVVSVLTGVTVSIRVRNIYTGSNSLGLDVKIN